MSQAMAALDAMPEIEKTSIFGTAVHAVLRADSSGLDRDGVDRRLEALAKLALLEPAFSGAGASRRAPAA